MILCLFPDWLSLATLNKTKNGELLLLCYGKKKKKTDKKLFVLTSKRHPEFTDFFGWLVAVCVISNNGQ